MYACGFVLGPGGEIVAVYRGVWQYPGAPWLIPLWLPPAWGLTALILFKLARAIGPEARGRPGVQRGEKRDPGTTPREAASGTATSRLPQSARRL